MSFQVPNSWEPNESTRAYAAGASASGVIDGDAELQKFRDFRFNDPVINADKLAVRWLQRAIEHGAKKAARKEEPGGKAALAMDRSLARIREFERTNWPEYHRIETYLAGHNWWAKASRTFQVEQLDQAIKSRDLIFEYLDSQGIYGGEPELQLVES